MLVSSLMEKQPGRPRALIVTMVLLSAVGLSLDGNADDLPAGVVNTQDPRDVPLIPQESLKRIVVPDGFQVTLFAGEPDLRRPLAFDFDDRGRLWVVENYSHPKWRQDATSDRVLIFEDADHDGRFDRRKVFWSQGRYLTGIAVGHGGVWLANTPELTFIPDVNGDDVPDGPPVVMLDGFQISTNNVLNNFHWGPDGWLYGAIGLAERSYVGKPGTPRPQRTVITRGIWRFHPHHQTFEVVASGMVNPWGADFNEYGDLFTTNTVTAHLWQIVPGMICQGRAAEEQHPFAYARIQSIADHLHWGGGVWQSSRQHAERHSVAGGGHAHCGAMIYLGDNWPDKYRGTLFTNNLHGNRVNNDRLVPHHSTYVGVHADDLLYANDPWFRGLSIKYGPDGGVYISDWHDLGECHDNDGSHRSSGRIFKVVYGTPAARPVNLRAATDRQLADLHLHPNVWFVRHARRILQERALAGASLLAARRRLRGILDESEDERQQLRALWTLFVMRDFTEPELVRFLQHPSLHVRRWAIRFLVDRSPPGQAALDAMVRLATRDDSAKVRLALASALQKLPLASRWEIATSLARHAEDAADSYLPLMIWYGIEPLLATDVRRGLQLALMARIPLLRRFVARRLLDVDFPPLEEVTAAVSRTEEAAIRFDLLAGMLAALQPHGARPAPQRWQPLYRELAASPNAGIRSVAVRLATLFGDARALVRLRQTALDPEEPVGRRRDALQALLRLEQGVPVAMLHKLVAGADELRGDAIRALLLHNDPTTAEVLLSVYAELEPATRQDAIGVLVSRRNFVETLLTALERRALDTREVSAFALQQLRTFKGAEIEQRVGALWSAESQQIVKADAIRRYKELLTPEYLARADAAGGRLLFDRSCAKCHTLFGEGGNIGPDLTGSGRRKLDYLLGNLIDPSAIIDPAYRLTTLLTVDGRLFSGFLIYQDDRSVVLRTQQTQVRLQMRDVDELITSNKSMMPEGMLSGYSDSQIRDLVRYLVSPQQVARPQPDAP
ncbi:MAG: dehydrogenase [Planctomycetaceae bacterium]|nr:dehydrogenase [Planctomycetaceae bacterium]